MYPVCDLDCFVLATILKVKLKGTSHLHKQVYRFAYQLIQKFHKDNKFAIKRVAHTTYGALQLRMLKKITFEHFFYYSFWDYFQLRIRGC